MSALLTDIGHESQILWLHLPRILWRGAGFPPPTHLFTGKSCFLLNTHIRINQQDIDLFGCQVISTHRKLQKHWRKERKKMFCNKGKNGLHLQRSCSCQNKEIYGIFVSGRMFRCISRINRVRYFQTMSEMPGEKAEGLTKEGSAREDGGWCRGRCHPSSQDKTWYQLKSHNSQWCPQCQ